jgi:hypothetical protein
VEIRTVIRILYRISIVSYWTVPYFYWTVSTVRTVLYLSIAQLQTVYKYTYFESG